MPKRVTRLNLFMIPKIRIGRKLLEKCMQTLDRYHIDSRS